MFDENYGCILHPLQSYCFLHELPVYPLDEHKMGTARVIQLSWSIHSAPNLGRIIGMVTVLHVFAN